MLIFQYEYLFLLPSYRLYRSHLLLVSSGICRRMSRWSSAWFPSTNACSCMSSFSLQTCLDQFETSQWSVRVLRPLIMTNHWLALTKIDRVLEPCCCCRDCLVCSLFSAYDRCFLCHRRKFQQWKRKVLLHRWPRSHRFILNNRIQHSPHHRFPNASRSIVSSIAPENHQPKAHSRCFHLPLPNRFLTFPLCFLFHRVQCSICSCFSFSFFLLIFLNLIYYFDVFSYGCSTSSSVSPCLPSLVHLLCVNGWCAPIDCVNSVHWFVLLHSLSSLFI